MPACATLYRMKIELKSSRKPFITKIDIVILLCIIALLASVGVAVKLVLQKDTFVTVELLASGGEWWWGVPPPYYWNAKSVVIGAKEYDTFKKPTAEIVDLVKYGEDDRKFMWIRVRLRAKYNYLTKEYIFRQESLQIGKTIHIAPNNVALVGNVVGIEGVGTLWDTEYLQITGKAIHKKDWEAEAIQIGVKAVDSKGDVVAEILDTYTEQEDITTTTWTGEPLHKKDPNFKNVTVTMRIRAVKDGTMRYFNYNQPISIGNKIRIQFPATAVEVNIMSATPAQ